MGSKELASARSRGTNGSLRNGISVINRSILPLREAISISKKDGAKMLIVFRTADLATVPKSSWKAIGPTIEEARKVGLRIHPLEPTSVCEIHAARDLYSDALQGNLDE